LSQPAVALRQYTQQACVMSICQCLNDTAERL